MVAEKGKGGREGRWDKIYGRTRDREGIGRDRKKTPEEERRGKRSRNKKDRRAGQEEEKVGELTLEIIFQKLLSTYHTPWKQFAEAGAPPKPPLQSL
jgi:hypothetical protein